jgi:transcriptional regulator of aromatic amino acid metabolism
MESVVNLLTGLCVRPVHARKLPCELSLPKGMNGTLLLWDVAQLARSQQLELHDWITGGQEDTQIISITSTPLLPLVEDGRFLEGLFYRINVLSLVVTVGNDRSDAHDDSVSQLQQAATPLGGDAVRRH